MLNDEIRDLIKIGLTESEAKVYFNLLKKKDFTATEISKLAQVSRPKVYEVLAKLVQKGLCTETFGRVRKYCAINPEVGFDNILKEFEEKKNIIYKISKSLLPLYHSEKGNTDPLDYIQILREKSAIITKYEYLHITAKEQILCFAKSPYVIASGNNVSAFNALKKGIIIKTIYEVKDTASENIKREILSFIQAGEKARFYKDLPLKMEVYDKKIVLLALVDNIYPKQSFTTIIIQHPDIAKAFINLFEDCWKKAINLEEFKLEGD
ncbi:TrmB family transcriptional regulator [bacterium]|nr:MAG: TrmB family transcriptional regulator [bacterium]